MNEFGALNEYFLPFNFIIIYSYNYYCERVLCINHHPCKKYLVSEELNDKSYNAQSVVRYQFTDGIFECPNSKSFHKADVVTSASSLFLSFGGTSAASSLCSSTTPLRSLPEIAKMGREELNPGSNSLIFWFSS